MSARETFSSAARSNASSAERASASRPSARSASAREQVALGVRRGCERAIGQRERFVGASAPELHLGERGQRGVVLRHDAQRFFEPRLRGIGLVALDLERSELHEQPCAALRIAPIARVECVTVEARRTVEIARRLAEVRGAHVARGAGTELHQPVVGVGGLGVAPELEPRVAEQSPRVGVVGIRLE